MLAAVAAVIALALVADCAVHVALAQTPFGPRPGASTSPQAAGGLVGWLFEKQSEFYRQISSAIRAAKTDGSAIWTLIGISFAYGVFHAAGPGHGKAVISSYLIANEETARRGIVLSFASAMLQALVAILIVGVGRLIFDAAAATMCSAERAVEIASYALIALVGARLVWTKGRGFLNSVLSWRGNAVLAPSLVPAMAFDQASAPSADREPGHADDHSRQQHVHDHAHGGDHDHAHRDHHHHGPGGHGHDHAHHDHDEHHGHSHGPLPSELSGPGGWQRGLGAIFAAGLRPCTGAILVLVFAFAQGLFGAGVAATLAMGVGTAITVATIAIVSLTAKGLARRLVAQRDGLGAMLLRGLEFGAAGVVLLFGVALLAGYLVAERATCF